MATHSGNPDRAAVAWSAAARNSQELPARRTEMTIPFGQSAWTFSSAIAIAISSASVLMGLLTMAAPDHASIAQAGASNNRCRGDDSERLSCANEARYLAACTRFDPTISGNEPVGTGSA